MKKSCIVLVILLGPLTGVCNTVLPIYSAEVMGRDLDSRVGKQYGHVGITMSPSLGQIATFQIEVLDDPNRVVQVNWMNDFKGRTLYWGSRYGIADQNNRTILVLREANSQRCLRSKYTLTTFFWPATGDLSGFPDDTCKTSTMGQFRCDTFLIHVYSVGDYYVLKSGATLPRNVFASFPNGNGDGPWAQNDKLQANKEKLPSANYSLDTLSLTDLNNLGLEEFISVMNTLENAKEPDIEDKIWGLYQNIEGTEKKTFLLDYLGGIGSPRILPQVIKDYSQNINPEIKYALLASTQPIYSRAHLLQNNLSMKQQLISLYLNLLESDSTKQLPFKQAQIVATGLTDIASKEVILENIEKINSIYERAKPYEQIGYKCNLMLDIQSLENSYIPQIIDLLIKENDRQLDERFFSYIKDALSRNNNNIFPKLKNLISNYLNSISYKFDNLQEGLSKSDNPASMFAFGAWIEASALVNSETLEDAGHYIAEFLKNKPTVDQANYIIGLSHAAYLQKAFKTESVFMNFVEKNKNIKSAPVSKEPKQKMINAGIEYSVSLIEGKI